MTQTKPTLPVSNQKLFGHDTASIYILFLAALTASAIVACS